MVLIESEQLVRAEEFFDKGELNQAYDMFKDLIKINRVDFGQKVYILFLMGLIRAYQQKAEEVIELGKNISLEAQKQNQDLPHFDGLFLMLLGFVGGDNIEKAPEILKKAENIVKSLSNVSKNDLILRESRISLIKAWIAFLTGKINLAEKEAENALDLLKEIEDTFEKVWAYLLLAQINIQIKSQFELSMEYSKKALSIAKNIRFNHYWIGYSYIGIATSYNIIYEYELNLKYHMKSLEIFKKIENNWYISNILNNIGLIYCEKGEYVLSLKYLEESLTLWEPYSFRIGAILDSLVYVALEMGDITRAQKYLNRLEERYYQKKEDVFRGILYHYNKAVMLKRSSRIRDIAKAEKLFKQIVQAENLFFDFKINAYVQLCDILLAEFRLSYDDEILDELNEHIPKLLTIAEESHSYLVFCETFILQAKLSLLNFDLKAARQFLTRAQQMAESKGITRLARKISYEHDKLIEQQSLWKKLKEANVPISERWELAGLSDQVKRMLKKGLSGEQDISDEEPVLLLIVSEGGVPFFSQSFKSNTSFEDHLFGGFFTTINNFVTEKFSEGLDRASFGKYTLLMNAFPPFFIYYIYKGQSYSAQKRITSFLSEIKNNEEIWVTFNKFYQMNRELEILDVPQLAALIKETFPLETS